MSKIAIIDIDGVLNDYPQTQIDFYNSFNSDKVKTLSELKTKLSYNDYKKLKLSYRLSDYKHDAKPKKDSKKLLKYLKKNNYLIYIITARKLFELNQLEKTITWLKKNFLNYDYLYCSAKKDFTIFEKFGKIDLVIEDNCDNIQKIQKINGNAKYFIVNNSENITKPCICKRVNFLKEIIEDLENDKRQNTN